MTDPYKALGVSPNATDDEIKKAYRELAKKYHPDNFHDTPLSELATEKMSQINAAYDEIQKMRERSSGASYGAPGGGYGFSSGGPSSFARVRELINGGRYAEAEIQIDSVLLGGRNAEWYFLKGVICIQRRNYFEAANYVKTACDMDPSNAEYRNVYQRLKASQQTYGGFQTSRGQGGCSTCDICSGLLCADCLCECCGGDLISCC